MSLLLKVCGLTEEHTFKFLDAQKVDFLGMIFYPKSPRFVSTQQAEILGKIKLEHAKKVGVFVNATYEELKCKAQEYQLDVLQLHGDEPVSLVRELHAKGYKIFKAFRIDESFNFEEVTPYLPFIEAFVFDAKGKDYGGNGVSYAWEILSKYKGDKPYFLSGGLDHNSAIKAYKNPPDGCFALDLNSKFEDAPGKKNIIKLNDLLSSIH